MKTDKVLVTCPNCGHSQHEPATAYSSVCKECRQYFRLEDVLRAAAQAGRAPATAHKEVRRVTCFQCGTELEVSPSAQSTMCKRCSSHLDLRDYVIANAVSKNFRTRGRFTVEEGGYVFNTESFVADAVVKGRFHGKLIADYTLEIHRTAEIKGSFKAGKLVIPLGSTFRWPEPIRVGGADIVGELIGDLKAEHTVVIRAGAKMFGNIEAGALVVESGAVVVGTMHIKPTPLNVHSPLAAPQPAPAVVPLDPTEPKETQLELTPAPAPPANPPPGRARSSRPPAVRSTVRTTPTGESVTPRKPSGRSRTREP